MGTDRGVCFCDVETTGIDPARYRIWEAGLIVDDVEYQWLFHLTTDEILEADEVALRIAGFHDRHPYGNGRPEIEWGPFVSMVKNDGPPAVSYYTWAETFASLTNGRDLVGAVPSFDEERLRKLLLAHGVRPSWEYHLVDVEALAAGWISAQCVGQANDGVGRGTVPVVKDGKIVNNIDGRPPWKSEDLSRAVGVNPDDFDRHTAIGDARWARAIYRAVTGHD